MTGKSKTVVALADRAARIFPNQNRGDRPWEPRSARNECHDVPTGEWLAAKAKALSVSAVEIAHLTSPTMDADGVLDVFDCENQRVNSRQKVADALNILSGVTLP